VSFGVFAIFSSAYSTLSAPVGCVFVATTIRFAVAGLARNQ